jgi:hypothetical protein
MIVFTPPWISSLKQILAPAPPTPCDAIVRRFPLYSPVKVLYSLASPTSSVFVSNSAADVARLGSPTTRAKGARSDGWTSMIGRRLSESVIFMLPPDLKFIYSIGDIPQPYKNHLIAAYNKAKNLYRVPFLIEGLASSRQKITYPVPY